ncbi:MAG: class I SAM-dependent methyltransferase [Chloroflexota bacterium]|nr:class I SAM-dependent methyltransferase [Chloroflexota bacterium]
MMLFRNIAIVIYRAYLAIGMKLWKHQRREPSVAHEILNEYTQLNSSLKTELEIKEAIRHLKSLKAFHHPDRPKNWDTCKGLVFILTHSDSSSAVLDVGCGSYGGVVLPSLSLYGYNRLCGVDLALRRDFSRGPIKYLRRDLTRTELPAESFNFIVSMSVIEHGVSLREYFTEMSRLLQPGGYLITSTDYWIDAINTQGLVPSLKCLGEVRIFNKDTIQEGVSIAEDVGFSLLEPIDYNCTDRVAYWKEVDCEFTYLQFIMQKSREHL